MSSSNSSFDEKKFATIRENFLDVINHDFILTLLESVNIDKDNSRTIIINEKNESTKNVLQLIERI